MIMQSDQKLTHFTPTKMLDPRADPHEAINILEQLKYLPISQALLSKYKILLSRNAQQFQATYKNSA